MSFEIIPVVFKSLFMYYMNEFEQIPLPVFIFVM